LGWVIGPLHASGSLLGSLVRGLRISIIDLMDFLYLQQGLESRPCREMLYIRCTLQTIVLLLFTSSIFKDTLYFLLKYVLPPVLFTLTQVVLLLITSTFTRVQTVQSNLCTTVGIQISFFGKQVTALVHQTKDVRISR
jgi:hypothetical protein